MTQGRSRSSRDDRPRKVPLQEQISWTYENDDRRRVFSQIAGTMRYAYGLRSRRRGLSP